MENKNHGFQEPLYTSKRIAFLFLDEIHHLYHFINIAVELAKNNKVSILTYPGCPTLLYETLDQLGGDKVKVEELPTQKFREITDRIKKRPLPRKGFWVKKNKRYLLENFDAIIFTDYFHKYLLESRKNNTPKLLKLSHGTPGRAYAFSEQQKDFDFQLLIGEFQFEQYKKLDLLAQDYVIMGYPKIDVINKIKHKTVFSNNKPTVLYNPHFDPEYSSWQKEGLNILKFFYDHPEYNLIFAPHLHLFQKNKGNQNKEDIPFKYLEANNIHIDLGSTASVDMTYLKNSDIYIGDVSSQVYEFITKPRPCIFLNTHHLNYQKDVYFRFWKCGLVLNNTKELGKKLKQAENSFSKFKEIQEEITRENYYFEENSTASERAALAINRFLEKSQSKD